MYSEIKAALESGKIISDIIRASHDLRNFNELASAVSELNAKLLAATTEALSGSEKIATLNERVRLLEQEIMKFENWETEAKNYTLQSVGVEKKHFAQVYNPVVQSTKERHWACAKCFQERKLYILSAEGRSIYKCPNCGNGIAPIIVGGSLAPIDSAYK